MLNCDNLEGILRDCSNALGGIDNRIYINDSENVDIEATINSITGDSHTIATITLFSGGTDFEVIEFRKNLATLTEDYTYSDDGAIMFNQTLTLPIHGRDAAKSRKISVLAAGGRELDIIIPTNDGGYVYVRKAQLTAVADGTGAAKADGSKYTLTFTAQSELLSYYVTKSAVEAII